MSATSTAPAPAPVAVGASNPDSSTPRPRPPRRGRGRGGRGRQTVNQAQAQTQTETQAQAAPDAPPRTQPQPPTDTTPNGDAPRPPRGPRGGNKRGGRGAGASRRPRGGDQATLPAGRIFGGKLTTPEQEQDGQAIPGGDGVDEAGLRADAPVGSNIQKQPRSQPPPPPAKVTTKSTAPDIATRIHEDIAHNLYECPICTSELGKRSRVWSCGLCWTVFHLSCVKKWSRNEGAAAAQRQDGENGESSAPRAWRCPGCNLPQEVFPSTYTCWCEKETEMLCSSKDEELDSELMREDDIEEWTGCFSCGDECSRPFDCGVHFCQKSCHAQDAHPAHCPRSPDVVFDCPCGKTPLDQIAGYSPRTSCEDPIPNCTKACGKPLACGHPCTKVCHTGACGPCFQKVPIECRCGRNTFTTVCPQGEMEPPQCFRICKAGLHCGRHACTERCCPGEQKAIERQAIRRKLKSHLRPSDEDFEAEHICTRVCGRMLKCGRHTCPEICHKGPCNTCREAIFEEIPCNCGRSILHPPLPCGTKPPACSFPCERPKPCGHPQTSHNCHTDDESCPKCPYLTEKTCLCGKRVLKNQPCWLADARCGQVCGQLLKCGSHTCQKHCHRPGDCEDATKPCQQACGKTKTMCGHPCTDPCHAPYPCPEKTPCKSMITVTCDCGRLRQERRCNAAKAVVSKGQLQQAQRGPAVTPLSCDDECARLERNRSLASALGVDINPTTTLSQSLTSTNLPYSAETLDIYIQLSSSYPLSTLQTIESTLHTLATTPTERSTRFQPAKSSLRAFTHSLAADWGFASESFDPEPHRHVFRLKEQEAQRLAAAEAKAQREAARAHSNGSSEGGWAQVAASKRSNPALGAGRSSAPSPASTSGTVTPAAAAPWSSSTMYAALDRDVGDTALQLQQPKKEKLVLRSGVKGSRSQGSSVEREKEGSVGGDGDA
ncbi:Major Facilitator Superfamily protein [Aspergillus niger]|uniref:Major Facilitator Superfamily protein n=1 Tax=Aspergillus niger TaxID=5061 RepID=A0A505I0V9_ASPNG|nr:Major Facilitator Superfamily protein [Aspergillus niger]